MTKNEFSCSKIIVENAFSRIILLVLHNALVQSFHWQMAYQMADHHLTGPLVRHNELLETTSHDLLFKRRHSIVSCGELGGQPLNLNLRRQFLRSPRLIALHVRFIT